MPSTINISLFGATKEDVAHWVGRKVYKPSGKKFKSRKKYNTVKGVVDHPVLGIPAFTFREDDSIVESRRCDLYLRPSLFHRVRKLTRSITARLRNK